MAQKPSKSLLHRRPPTHCLIWTFAILCAILTVAVIIGGMAVFIGYLIIRPKVPFISVTYTHLDVFEYDQAGLLTTEVAIFIKWENDNAKAHASFHNAAFILSLHGLEMAKLVAPPFDVSKNSSVEFQYHVESSPIPLDPQQMALVDMALKRDRIMFDLRGSARTRWKVGPFGSVKFLLPLNCQLHFILSSRNGTGPYCSSRNK